MTQRSPASDSFSQGDRQLGLDSKHVRLLPRQQTLPLRTSEPVKQSEPVILTKQQPHARADYGTVPQIYTAEEHIIFLIPDVIDHFTHMHTWWWKFLHKTRMSRYETKCINAVHFIMK